MKKIFLWLNLLLLPGCFYAYHTGRETAGIQYAYRDYEPKPCSQCFINFSNQQTWDILAFPISISMILPSFIAGIVAGGISQISDAQKHHPPTSLPAKEHLDLVQNVEILEVLSGDTIKLKDGRVIKYLGINSPQKDEFFF